MKTIGSLIWIVAACIVIYFGTLGVRNMSIHNTQLASPAPDRIEGIE